MPKEAIMDPLVPGKPPQPAPREAEMSHSCWVETCSNCQPTGSQAAKGCCKPQNWGVTCYTATDNWNKAFFPVFSELKLMKLLPFHSELKLGCQKWHLKSSTPHQQPSSPTGLQTAPNMYAGKLTRESNAATKTIPSARSTSYFFPFQGKMRSGGWGRGKWHRCSPLSKFQGFFFFLLYSFFFLATAMDPLWGARHRMCITFKEVSLEIPIFQMKKPRHPEVMGLSRSPSIRKTGTWTRYPGAHLCGCALTPFRRLYLLALAAGGSENRKKKKRFSKSSHCLQRWEAKWASRCALGWSWPCGGARME